MRTVGDIMTYEEELLDKLKDAGKWPAFKNLGHLSILNDMADRAFSKSSFEGYIAAVAIYHQLSADMVGLLLDDIHFLTQCSLYPLELRFKKKKTPMFGTLVRRTGAQHRFQAEERLSLPMSSVK